MRKKIDIPAGDDKEMKKKEMNKNLFNYLPK